jgi:hypothetical protein
MIEARLQQSSMISSRCGACEDESGSRSQSSRISNGTQAARGGTAPVRRSLGAAGRACCARRPCPRRCDRCCDPGRPSVRASWAPIQPAHPLCLSQELQWPIAPLRGIAIHDRVRAGVEVGKQGVGGHCRARPRVRLHEGPEVGRVVAGAQVGKAGAVHPLARKAVGGTRLACHAEHVAVGLVCLREGRPRVRIRHRAHRPQGVRQVIGPAVRPLLANPVQTVEIGVLLVAKHLRQAGVQVERVLRRLTIEALGQTVT